MAPASFSNTHKMDANANLSLSPRALHEHYNYRRR
jgi:hypothetical protein